MPSCPELRGNSPIETSSPSLILETVTNDFGAVDNWLTDKKVILIVDELNIVPPTTPRNEDMCALVANIVQRDGCAARYSTHQRSTADILRGRVAG